MNADQRFDELAQRLGYSFDGEIKIGGNYTPLVVDGDVAYVSGQVPRVGDTVVVTNKGSGGWRELLSGAGTRSVSVGAAGIFLGSEAEAAIRAHALAGTLDQYELAFEGGETWHGRFLIQRLDYAGDFNGERTYTVALESSGPVLPS